MAYIYKIENKHNGKLYIGKTEHDDPFVRWNEHIREARKERSKNRALYRAINKYGFNSFKFEVIEKTSNPEEREIFYINQFDTYKNGYNETLGGDGTAYLNLPEKEICKKYSMYKSISQLASEYNCDHTSIRKILLNNNIKLHPLGSHLLKKVAQIDKDTGEVIHIYNSIKEAEQTIGNSKHISDVCKGKRKTAKGFIWRYIEE